ncbi:MAG: alginate lyase family protein [Bacteroidota bacterium]
MKRWNAKCGVRIVVCLIMFAAAVMGQSVPTFKPMFISPNGVRDVLAAKDREPWKSAVERVKQDADKALKQPVQSVVTSIPKPTPDDAKVTDAHYYYTAKPYWWLIDGKWVRKDGEENPATDRRDYEAAVAMSGAIRDLGVGYVYTGDVRFARKAITLLNAWCNDKTTRMTPRYTTQQSYIELSITMPALVYGFTLVENFPEWTAAGREATREWIRTFATTGLTWKQPGNYNSWRAVMIASAGVATGSKDLLNYAYALWAQNLYHEVVGTDGKDSETGLTYVWVNNKKVTLRPGMLPLEMRRTDALFYSTYALNAMTQAAEILSRNGYKTFNHKSLLLALDFHAPYLVDPKKWNADGYLQASAAKAALNYALYELAFAQYKSPSYDAVVKRWGRPAIEGRVMGNVTTVVSPKR